MAASALMSVGTQAVFAAYRQVQTTANNIANANVEGYSRQRVELQTNGSDDTAAGFIGRGVSAATVSRASNLFLAQQTSALVAANGADAARADMLKQLEQVFGKTETGLGHAAAEVFGAYGDLAAAPSDLSARQSALGRLDDFASLARATAQRIDELTAQTQQDVQNGLAEVNGLARDVAELNKQIVNALATGHQPNELLDRRDVLVQHISEQLQVHTVGASDGSLSVFVSSGESLVLGGNASRMVALPDPDNANHLMMGVKVHDELTLLRRGIEGEGAVAGLLRFQNEDLTAARNRLGQLVSAVALTLNRQQSLGLDMSGQPGSRLFAFDDPQALPSANNQKDANGAFIASMSVTITEPSLLEASDYLVEADGAGTYTVTRLSDGLARPNIAAGSEIDGFRLDNGANAPQPGEVFLLRTVSASASSLELDLRNPRGLAAANPVVGSASVANRGTVAVSGVTIQAPPAAGYAELTIRFTDDAGTYEVLDAGGAVLRPADPNDPWRAGSPIVWDGIALTLSGQPRQDDAVLIQPTAHPMASNGNALAMSSFGEQRLVRGQTATDAFAALLSDMGVRTQTAVARATNTGAALVRSKEQLASETGVNLDEEAARLIQYQQSYQAAAKVIQAAQAMLDTVIDLVRL